MCMLKYRLQHRNNSLTPMKMLSPTAKQHCSGSSPKFNACGRKPADIESSIITI